MINIFRKYHIINNFPPSYPLYKKIIANFLFFFFGMIIHPRKNRLTHDDLARARLMLRKGDILLVGNLETILSSVIREPVTHSAIYVGHHRFIHSFPDGIQYISLYKVYTDYDTMVLLRLPKKTPDKGKIIDRVMRYVKKQYGKPYDYEFKHGAQSFFCTELVNESYQHAGYNSGLISLKRPKRIIKKIEEKISGAVDALEPINFLNGNFDVVFLSHNLELKHNKLSFVDDNKQLKN